MQAGKYGAGVLGDLPHDLLGIMGDWVKNVRARRWAELCAETERILRELHVENREEVSPSVAIPLIAAAVNEDRDVLKQLWAKLLAAAMDPARTDLVRPSLIELLKKMDPLDARIIEHLAVATIGPTVPDGPP
jgi:Abortive infection alpha